MKREKILEEIAREVDPEAIAYSEWSSEKWHHEYYLDTKGARRLHLGDYFAQALHEICFYPVRFKNKGSWRGLDFSKA